MWKPSGAPCRYLPVTSVTVRGRTSTNAGDIVNRQRTSASMPSSGGGGRRFKSSHSDHLSPLKIRLFPAYGGRRPGAGAAISGRTMPEHAA